MNITKQTIRNARGFTLIEILVVVVIIGILGAIIVPQIMKRPDQARIVRVHQDLASIQSALDMYKLDNGFYPTTDQGLDALVTKPSTPPVPNNWQAYLSRKPTDPWSRPYHYLNPGEHGEVDIFTYGPTGQPGGTAGNAEIGNWMAS
ncbi:MAG: type II secretion system protein GspG [Gammaproteobacteria bacterium]|nr:type II secretion system protein GspG [Gammaproteobacteria bacterium]